MYSCQIGPGSLGSSVHTVLHYNSCTVPEGISPVDPRWIVVKQVQEDWVVLRYNSCTVPEGISPVDPRWIAVKQVKEVWVVLFIQNYTIIPVLYLKASAL